MMHGIEFEEFPARIAEVAMWLIDHQMNMQISNEFGQYFVRLPLKKSAKIVHGNALQIDWETVVAKDELSYILGNPPFIGKDKRTAAQTADMEFCCSDVPNFKTLDYVSAWFVKAAKFINENGGIYPSGELFATRIYSSVPKIKVAFVSTNSITQGEQIGVLWHYLLDKGAKIHFAHRTFKWNNEATGNAAVYCVIIGFGLFDVKNKRLFEYNTPKSEPHEIEVKNINPYLIDYPDLVISERNITIGDFPEIVNGNKPTDGGFLLLTDEDKLELLSKEPNSSKFILPFVSAHEFLNGKTRWCLWLESSNMSEWRKMPSVMERVKGVRDFRLKSTKQQTVKIAEIPYLFGQIRQPNSDYVLIPRHSSENRRYIPIAFLSKDSIIADSCSAVPNATIYHFGILTSSMHMAWMRQVCGRLKSDYRYSNNLVYNNFPWAENPTAKQIKNIEEKAQKVLDTRAAFPTSSLADLYDPLTMPPALVKAHNELDKAVDLAYRPQPFTSEANRMVFLFELYEKYTAGLFTETKAKKNKRKV